MPASQRVRPERCVSSQRVRFAGARSRAAGAWCRCQATDPNSRVWRSTPALPSRAQSSLSSDPQPVMVSSNPFAPTRSPRQKPWLQALTATTRFAAPRPRRRAGCARPGSSAPAARARGGPPGTRGARPCRRRGARRTRSRWPRWPRCGSVPRGSHRAAAAGAARDSPRRPRAARRPVQCRHRDRPRPRAARRAVRPGRRPMPARARARRHVRAS